VQPSIKKYLANYAEKESVTLAKSFADNTEKTWDYALTLPLCGEWEQIPPLLESIEKAAEFSGKKVLTIALINGRDDHPPEIHYCNAKVAQHLRSRTPRWVTFLPIEKKFLPKQGVGLARKLAADIAVALFGSGRIRCPIIATTDADARLPIDYFAKLSSANPRPATYVFPFIHDVDKHHKALIFYEIWLRYYTQGLRTSGSLYAYHCLGSTLAIHAEAYAMVRGFPDVLAAEDFYILNKLAKLGKIKTLNSFIHLSPRTSNRVPFGTGVGTQKIENLLERGERFRLYDPRVFDILKHLLLSFQQIGNAKRPSEVRELFLERVPSRQRVGQLFYERGIDEALAIAFTTRKTSGERIRHMHTWFDAFQTLKWIHALRANIFPDIPWQEALQQCSYLEINSTCHYEALMKLRLLDAAHYGILSDEHGPIRIET